MRGLLNITGMAVAAAIALGGLAQAQTNCAPRDVVVERLKDSFGETLAGGGLRSALQVLEIWASPATGTWTVLITQADGISCVLASGTNWHQQVPAPVLMGVPS